MNPCKFEVSNLITALSFLGQYKQVYDSNEVSESVAMWLVAVFKAKSFASPPAVCLTFTNKGDAPPILYREIKRQNPVYTYIVAVNYLL